MAQELKIRHLSGSMQSQEKVYRDFPLPLGRADDCSVRFDADKDLKVSAHHAEIRRSNGGGFEVWDLDSKNGVFVNGQKVTGWTQLPSKATLEVGKGGPKLEVTLVEGGSGITFSDVRHKETKKLADPGKPLHATDESFPVYDSQEMGSGATSGPSKGLLVGVGVIVLAILAVIIAAVSMGG